eukprot:GFUD01002815.1.p1 GENE.GFUD01002815.1~~GFUD01002815.1.p1  ORF type:complete len:245 (+),score=49.10 GFUD01002815.1:116-850(+)
MANRQLTLVCVRHGQADHNVRGNAPIFVFTEEEKPALNSDLTELGRQQANLVAKRLSTQKFDFAISSDLKRAKDTADPIASLNETIETVVEWKTVRERCFGIFEKIDPELCRSQLRVEDAIKDKDLLTWRIPKGESVVDLRKRIEEFVRQLIRKTQNLQSKEPTILCVSHGLFLKELHRVLSRFGSSGPMFGQGDVSYPNTGVSQYRIGFGEAEEEITQAECQVYACGDHLEARINTSDPIFIA